MGRDHRIEQMMPFVDEGFYECYNTNSNVVVLFLKTMLDYMDSTMLNSTKQIQDIFGDD